MPEKKPGVPSQNVRNSANGATARVEAKRDAAYPVQQPAKKIHFVGVFTSVQRFERHSVPSVDRQSLHEATACWMAEPALPPQ
jgi:hypothetical protein